VLSNHGRGVWMRDSPGVIVFNNLIYANGGTGIDFAGEGDGSSGGVAVGNTVYGNALDGIRVEGLVASRRVTVVQNVIAQNLGRGRQPLHGALVRADPQLDGNRGNARLGPGRPRLSLRERNGPGVTLQEGGGEEDRSASRSGAHLPETGVAGRLAVRQLVAPTPSSMRPTGREIVRLRTGSGTFVDPETRSFLCLADSMKLGPYCAS